VRVGAHGDVWVRVSELRGDVDGIQLQADDEQGRERMSERMGADPLAELGRLTTKPERGKKRGPDDDEPLVRS
jgi:hypothetical protein